jgi:thiamine biosynthesis lipoprotein
MAPGRVVTEHRFRAMGTWGHVLVHHDGSAAHVAGEAPPLVEGYEAAWSRFRPTSDIGRANLAAGGPVAVADATLLAVATALRSRVDTGGRYDPTVLRCVEAAGYDRDFAQVAARAAVGALRTAPPAPTGAPVALDLEAGTVAVPAGTALDLGGIGKGLAADLVAGALLLERGVLGVVVNLGGDLRTAGAAPTPAGWGVALDDPRRPAATLATLALGTGGLATSSTRRRRWSTPHGERHHVIDPGTGASATTSLAAATVLAATAAGAEVWATAALVAGPDAAEVLAAAPAPVAGLLVPVEGEPVLVGSMAAHLR